MRSVKNWGWSGLEWKLGAMNSHSETSVYLHLNTPDELVYAFLQSLALTAPK